jgi:hypothetical protein
MTASVSGAYDFSGVATPPAEVYMSTYDGEYSSADCLTADYDAVTTNLEAGVTYLFVVWLCPDANCYTDFTGQFDIQATGPGTVAWSFIAADSPSGEGIPPWVQGYGRGASTDACKDGWDPSWEQWPNEGRGGWVCTRSVPSLG